MFEQNMSIGKIFFYTDLLTIEPSVLYYFMEVETGPTDPANGKPNFEQTHVQARCKLIYLNRFLGRNNSSVISRLIFAFTGSSFNLEPVQLSSEVGLLKRELKVRRVCSCRLFRLSAFLYFGSSPVKLEVFAVLWECADKPL